MMAWIASTRRTARRRVALPAAVFSVIQRPSGRVTACCRLRASRNLLLIMDVDPRGASLVVALRPVAVRTPCTRGLRAVVVSAQTKLTPALRALGYKKPVTSRFAEVNTEVVDPAVVVPCLDVVDLTTDPLDRLGLVSCT
jgi:hypothetical protein